MLPWKDFLDLVIPRYCIVCGKAIFEEYEKYFCLPCYADLPLFPYSVDHINPIIKTFWGRYVVFKGGALLMYHSGSRYSEIFKEIKYRDRPDLGFYLGYLYGTKLKKDFPNLLAQINILMPVPLSKKKKLARGYNQSEMIAKGLSKATGIRMETSFLKRIRSKGSQTKEGRFERWLNVKSVYDCEKFPQEWKHIALVDDVITTGSTIGACMESVIKLNKVDISVLCLGYTNS